MHLEALMFDLNFISNPGFKEKPSNETWSYFKQEEIVDHGRKDKVVKERISLFNNEKLKNYFLLLFSFGLIFIMSFLNSSSTQFDFKNVIEDVLDLMIISEYKKDFDLQKMEFSSQNISMLFSLDDISNIYQFEKINNLSEEAFFEVYNKNSINYVNILFPWFVLSEKTSIEDAKLFIDEMIFSKKIIINQNNEMIYFHSTLSDVVTFLLNMLEKKQINKNNILISRDGNGDYQLSLYFK